MASHFYFEGEPDAGYITLVGDEAHHLSKASRHDVGDRMTGFNGDGRGFVSIVREVGRREVVLEVETVEAPIPATGPELTIASALPKGDRFDFLLEKLTELNVAAFVPLTTRRSIVVPSADKMSKWRRATIEACKQCGRRTLPRIDPPTSWEHFAASDGLPEARFILSTQQGPIALPRMTSGEIVVAVGPEGGWSDEEEEFGLGHGWRTATLGRNTLRVETAGITAAARLSG